MSRKLTSYPRKACQRDISFNFASKEAIQALVHLFNTLCFFLQRLHLSRAREIAHTKTHKMQRRLQRGHGAVGKFISEPSVA